MRHTTCSILCLIMLALLGCASRATLAHDNSDLSQHPIPNTLHLLAVPADTNVRVDTDVVYGTPNGFKLLMDVYRPEGVTGKRPGVIFIHGGGWQAGDKRFYAPMARDLAAKGYVAVSINYRLLPTYRYPAEFDDAQRAVRYLRAHCADYDLDPARIGALGDSAGGYLVALLGTRETRDNSDAELAKFSSKVQCVVDFYGPTDFTVPPGSPDVSPLAIQIVAAFLGKSPTEAPDLYKESSPITYVDKDSAPFLIIHGSKDGLVPVGQSERLYDALHAINADVSLLLAYKLDHGFLNPAHPTSYGAVSVEFFNRILKP